VKTIVVNIYICGSVNTPNVKFNSIKLQNSSQFLWSSEGIWMDLC